MNPSHLEAYIIILGCGFILIMTGIKVWFDLRDKEDNENEKHKRR